MKLKKNWNKVRWFVTFCEKTLNAGSIWEIQSHSNTSGMKTITLWSLLRSRQHLISKRKMFIKTLPADFWIWSSSSLHWSLWEETGEEKKSHLNWTGWYTLAGNDHGKKASEDMNKASSEGIVAHPRGSGALGCLGQTAARRSLSGSRILRASGEPGCKSVGMRDEA